MLKPQAGMNDVRMIQPLRSIGTQNGVRISLSSESMHIFPKEIQIPKIMIWQRQLLRYDDDSLERIKRVINAGYILISELTMTPIIGLQ